MSAAASDECDRRAAGPAGQMTPAQCRAARTLLGWSQEHLAEAASLTTSTVGAFEGQKGTPQPMTVGLLRRALERAGIEFTDGDMPDVRMADTKSG